MTQMFKKVLSRLKLSCNRNNILILISLTTILLFSAYLRLVNLTKVGMIGADVFQYWEIAKWWTEGNYTLDGFYRPAIYFIDSLAIRLFGPYDYSLSLLHVLMDLFNIILIFYITSMIAKNKWSGICSILIYAFFPGIINFSRLSLIHIPSATFVLFSLLFYLKFDEYITRAGVKKILFLISSGLAVSVSAHIHPDLTFFAPVYVTLTFFTLKKKKFNTFIQLINKWIKYALIFSLSFFSLFLIGIFFYGIYMVFGTLTSERITGAENISPIQLFDQILIESLATHTFKSLPLLFFMTIPIVLLRKLLRKKDELSTFIPTILIVGYSIVGSFLLTRYISRLVIPLIPLVVISIVIWYQKLLELIVRNKKYAIFLLTTVSLLIAKDNLIRYKPEFLRHLQGKQTFYRETYDVMKDKVDSNHKILIAPYILYSHRKGFQAPFYFGENAPYIIDFPYSGFTLDQLVKEKKIKYLYISKIEYDYRILKQPKREIPIDFYGLRKTDWENGYSVEEEMKILNEFIQRNKTQKIFESENGTIYELN